MNAKTFWENYLKTLPENSPKPEKYFTDSFGDSPQMANELSALVLSGKKTATCALSWNYEADNEPVPTVGQLTVILDGRMDPVCIIETLEVSIVEYNKVDADHARQEGEGDLSLEFWRKVHWEFFKRHCPKGKTLTQTMPIVCEKFKVVYPKN